jgi:membrane-bound serine protease (ClpP class)
MAPETVIGAASPINVDGTDINETAYRKAVEDLKATMRGLTERRGEEAVALAEAMIEEARAVNANEALEVGLIDVVAENVDDLLQQLDGLTVTVNEQPVTLQTADAGRRPFPLNAIETVLHAVANPILIGILFAIGVQAILIEISNPGGWVAGFIGVLFLVLAFYGIGQLPVNWLGLGLVILAFVLFLMEAHTASHGALAITGAITLFAGLLVLFNSPGTPEFARISIPGAIAITLFTAGFFVFLVTMALRAQKRPATTGVEGMVGQAGTVRTVFTSPTHKAPYRGMVLVMGELWQAEADEELEKGERVIVTAVDGFTLQVARKGDRKHEDREPTTSIEGT